MHFVQMRSKGFMFQKTKFFKDYIYKLVSLIIHENKTKPREWVYIWDLHNFSNFFRI
jgi:hypothetical protein